jgi:hypothetical protein|tara:strand:- start:64 stop:432 length:369 start_codon:yes stop_codon:yes gene_type:complete
MCKNSPAIKSCLLGIFFISSVTVSGCLPVTLGGIGASSYQQHMIRTKIKNMEDAVIKLKNTTIKQQKLINESTKSTKTKLIQKNKLGKINPSIYGPYSDDITYGGDIRYRNGRYHYKGKLKQ